MENDNEVKDQNPEKVASDGHNPEADSSTQTGELRLVKGINGDFIIVNKAGIIVGMGLGF